MMTWDLWKKSFDQWEDATARLVEQFLRSPLLLGPSGQLLSTAMRAKAQVDRNLATAWGNVGLATKRDQERTLHLLNQLQGRLIDLEEQLAAAQHAAPTTKPAGDEASLQ
jgi:hypothetical protein